MSRGISIHNADVWFRPLRPSSNSNLRFFIFPHAGGGVSAYRQWSQGFPPSWEIRVLQLPGREDRISEPLFSQMEQLIATVQPVIKLLLDLPVVFFGHSVGAVIAYELARSLAFSNQQNIKHLFISGRPSPHMLLKEELIHDSSQEVLVQHLKDLGGTPKELLDDPEFIDVFLPPYRADVALSENYKWTPGASLNFPITALGGLEDETTQEQLKAWSGYTQKDFFFHSFPGNHFFIFSQKSMVQTAIQQDLAKTIGLQYFTQ